MSRSSKPAAPATEAAKPKRPRTVVRPYRVEKGVVPVKVDLGDGHTEQRDEVVYHVENDKGETVMRTRDRDAAHAECRALNAKARKEAGKESAANAAADRIVRRAKDLIEAIDAAAGVMPPLAIVDEAHRAALRLTTAGIAP